MISCGDVAEPSVSAPFPASDDARLIKRHRYKRIFDVAASIFLLVLAAPIFVLLAIAVTADRGPVFYVHNRIGRNGRKFGCLKFRTMRVDAEKSLQALLQADPRAAMEWHTSRKLRLDPRVTWVGRILRKSSLDELPQLLNVLSGDMSLVGPRPVVLEELQRHYDVSAAQMYLSVRPGLTGLWQVSGRSDTTYSHRIALDCAYVETLSLWNDMRLLARTVSVMLRGTGAY